MDNDKQEYQITCGELTKMFKTAVTPERLLRIFETQSKAAKFGPYTLRINFEKATERYKLTVIKYKIFLTAGYCPELEAFLKKRKIQTMEEDYSLNFEESFIERMRRAAEEGRRRISKEINCRVKPQK